VKKTINVIQYGLGNVGCRLLELADDLNNSSQDLKIKYVAAAELEGAIINPEGIDIKALINAKKTNSLKEFPGFIPGLNNSRLIDTVKNHNIENCVVVDVSASEEIISSIVKALDTGYHAVLANKKPISMNYIAYEKLNNLSKRNKVKLLYECTVGAGLPIIYTLQSLVKTCDIVEEINGCFSGTLGYIFSELEKQKKFSDIVKNAKELRYTEPDPRDDLSGMDVARKALILARICGSKLDLQDINIENLVPEDLRKCSVDEFMSKLEKIDSHFFEKSNAAKQKGNTLRYVATFSNKKLEIGVREIPLESPLGRLKGPENICVIRTKRYKTFPLIIQGPGAGVDVTADGVLRNIIECIEV